MIRHNRVQVIQNAVSKLINDLSFIVQDAIEYNEAEDTIQCKAAEHLMRQITFTLDTFKIPD